jgi:hypothetical protein
MPDRHCLRMPQVTAVDGQFGTHRILLGYAGANRDQILAGIDVLDQVLPHGRQAAT